MTTLASCNVDVSITHELDVMRRKQSLLVGYAMNKGFMTLVIIINELSMKSYRKKHNE